MHALIPCLLMAALQRYTFTEVHMGTQFKIVVYAAEQAVADKAVRAAFARIKQLDGVMSDYKQDSELMRLCLKSGGPPVAVSPELFHVLERAQALARRSGGAFDVTVGPVVREWRLARKAKRLPTKEDLAEALALVGHEKMLLDPKARTVELKKAGMRLDLGGIGKGYAADEAVKVLRDHGLTRVLVAAAGDIVAGDPPPGEKGWTIGIAPLDDPDAKPSRFVLLANSAVSTSGDARQHVEIDGKRYSHIVDPRTGIGVLGQFSVTVTAQHGIDSDSLTKAALLLGPEKGLKLIEATPGAACRFVRKMDGKEQEFRSKNFAFAPQEKQP